MKETTSCSEHLPTTTYLHSTEGYVCSRKCSLTHINQSMLVQKITGPTQVLNIGLRPVQEGVGIATQPATTTQSPRVTQSTTTTPSPCATQPATTTPSSYDAEREWPSGYRESYRIEQCHANMIM